MENNNPKISLIIIDFMDEYYEKLFWSIQKQTFFDIEIIIADDDITNNKNNSEIYEKLAKNDKRIKIIKYKNQIGKLKKRIDSVEASRAQYIIFIDGDDFFSSNDVLKVIYEKIVNDNVDILEFKSFHYLQLINSLIYRQPELFDIMYFRQDEFYGSKQYHVTGKIIKKKLFLNITKDFDGFYLNQVINNYEESMFLLLLFKKADSFELLRIKGTEKNCSNCLYRFSNIYNNEEAKKDLLLYSKMLIQYGDNNVPERRGAAYFFINYVLNRNISFANKKYTQFLKEVIELYLACDKISKPDKIVIKNFQNKNNNK
jgi:glycosyltransferase involved in cell wall biosynthesis